MYFDLMKGTHHCGPCSYMYMYQPPLVEFKMPSAWDIDVPHTPTLAHPLSCLVPPLSSYGIHTTDLPPTIRRVTEDGRKVEKIDKML